MYVSIRDDYGNRWHVKMETIPLVDDFVQLCFNDPNGELELEWRCAKVACRIFPIRPSDMPDELWLCEGDVELRVVLACEPPAGLFADSQYISAADSKYDAIGELEQAIAARSGKTQTVEPKDG